MHLCTHADILESGTESDDVSMTPIQGGGQT